MSLPIIYLWDFMPIIFGILFFYVARSFKISKETIKVYLNRVEYDGNLLYKNNQEIEKERDPYPKDFFEIFGKEELIINGLLSKKADDDYMSLFRKELGIFDFRFGCPLKPFASPISRDRIVIFSTDRREFLDRILRFDPFSGFLLHYVLTSRIKIVTIN
jgi:hypothetical protein